MSNISQRNQTANQITTDYDLSKIFLLNNRYENDTYLSNSGYATLTLLAGSVMGRIAATNQLTYCQSGALDGSQFPIGVLAQDVTLLAGQTQQVAICIFGDVASAKLIFVGGDNLNTVISGRTMKDHLQGYGVLVRVGTEMTDYDN